MRFQACEGAPHKTIRIEVSEGLHGVGFAARRSATLVSYLVEIEPYGPQSEAAEVANQLLDTSSRAVLTHDFDAFNAVVSLPYETETFGAKVVFKTQDDLRLAFFTMADDYKRRGITALQRDLISAKFTAKDQITYAYTTRLLAEHLLAADAYPNIAIAQRVDGVWRLVASQHALDRPHEFKGRGTRDPWTDTE